MGIKLFLNIFLNVDNAKIRWSRLTKYGLLVWLTSYCVVCACVDVVCLLMNIRWVKRYCRIQKLVRPFFSDGRADGTDKEADERTDGGAGRTGKRIDKQTNGWQTDGPTDERTRQWTINTKTDVWMNRTDWQRQANTRKHMRLKAEAEYEAEAEAAKAEAKA